MSLLVFLLVLWILCMGLGLFIKGLFWLTIIAAIAFVVTGVWGMLSRG